MDIMTSKGGPPLPRIMEADMDLTENWQSERTLIEGLRILFENGIGTDIIFVFPDCQESVKTHRVVLMARSPVFFDMFNTGKKFAETEIEIDDIAPNLFHEFIRYLYTEHIQITSENMLHLMFASQKYQIESLKTKCRAFLNDNVTQKNAGQILDQALLFKQGKISQTCLDFISRSKTLGALADYHVSRETLEAIVECETIAVSQLTLFQKCNDWAEKECSLRSMDTNRQNKRRVLGPILKKIRYTSMTSKDFASEVSGQGLLSPDEELEVFRYLNDPPKPAPPSPSKERTAVCAKLPSDLIGTYDITAPGFQIYIICELEFKLLGFIFNQEGTFSVRLNDDYCEEFYVTAEDVKKIRHLSQPVPCDSKKGMDIRNQKLRYAFRDKRAKTYSFSTIISNTSTERVTFYFKPYVCSAPPFNTLIFAL